MSRQHSHTKHTETNPPDQRVQQAGPSPTTLDNELNFNYNGVEVDEATDAAFKKNLLTIYGKDGVTNLNLAFGVGDGELTKVLPFQLHVVTLEGRSSGWGWLREPLLRGWAITEWDGLERDLGLRFYSARHHAFAPEALHMLFEKVAKMAEEKRQNLLKNRADIKKFEGYRSVGEKFEQEKESVEKVVQKANVAVAPVAATATAAASSTVSSTSSPFSGAFTFRSPSLRFEGSRASKLKFGNYD